MNLRVYAALIVLTGLIGWSCNDKQADEQAEHQAFTSAMTEIKRAMVEKNYDQAWKQLVGELFERRDA